MGHRLADLQIDFETSGPMIYQFIVYGAPISQPRTKAQAFVEKATGRVFAHMYEPGKKDSPARQWKADIKQEAIKHKPAAPYDGPVEVKIDFYFPRPQYMMAKKFSDDRILHTKKPDRDNCEKAVLDALKGIFFVDDCQVCAGEVRKFYHEKTGSGPHAVVMIGELAK